MSSAVRLLNNDDWHEMLCCCSLRRGTLRICSRGFFYEISTGTGGPLSCAQYHFDTLNGDLDLDCMDHIIPQCRVGVGATHNHDPPPRELVAILLFRWRCMLLAVYNPFTSNPRGIIREVYRDFRRDVFPLSITLDRAIAYFWRGVRSLMRRRVEDPLDTDVARWLRALGSVPYDRTLARFRDSRLWKPRGLLAPGDSDDEEVLAPYEGREILAGE